MTIFRRLHYLGIPLVPCNANKTSIVFLPNRVAGSFWLVADHALGTRLRARLLGTLMSSEGELAREAIQAIVALRSPAR